MAWPFWSTSTVPVDSFDETGKQKPSVYIGVEHQTSPSLWPNITKLAQGGLGCGFSDFGESKINHLYPWYVDRQLGEFNGNELRCRTCWVLLVKQAGRLQNVVLSSWYTPAPSSDYSFCLSSNLFGKNWESELGCVWKCCVPLNPMVNDHYPY